jgi:hypothetical protein
MKFSRNGFVASLVIFRGSYRIPRAGRLFEDLICCSIVPEMMMVMEWLWNVLAEVSNMLL